MASQPPEKVEPSERDREKKTEGDGQKKREPERDGEIDREREREREREVALAEGEEVKLSGDPFVHAAATRQTHTRSAAYMYILYCNVIPAVIHISEVQR